VKKNKFLVIYHKYNNRKGAIKCQKKNLLFIMPKKYQKFILTERSVTGKY